MPLFRCCCCMPDEEGVDAFAVTWEGCVGGAPLVECPPFVTTLQYNPAVGGGNLCYTGQITVKCINFIGLVGCDVEETVEILLCCTADPCEPTGDGCTAFSLSVTQGATTVSGILPTPCSCDPFMLVFNVSPPRAGCGTTGCTMTITLA